jgi:hypothetical protein
MPEARTRDASTTGPAVAKGICPKIFHAANRGSSEVSWSMKQLIHRNMCTISSGSGSDAVVAGCAKEMGGDRLGSQLVLDMNCRDGRTLVMPDRAGGKTRSRSLLLPS